MTISTPRNEASLRDWCSKLAKTPQAPPQRLGLNRAPHAMDDLEARERVRL